MRKILPPVAALIGGLALFGTAPAAEARTGLSPAQIERLAETGEYTAYGRHRRRVVRRGRRGNAAAAAAAVGIAGALIGGAIAAHERDRYYDDPYGYPPPPPGYAPYGPGPGYW